MEPITIGAFHFDDENEDKIAAHSLSSEQVEQLLEDAYVVRRNRASRRARYLVIGRDRSGQCIAVPIEETADPLVWRPVTAWYCKETEWARLPRRR